MEAELKAAEAVAKEPEGPERDRADAEGHAALASLREEAAVALAMAENGELVEGDPLDNALQESELPTGLAAEAEALQRRGQI